MENGNGGVKLAWFLTGAALGAAAALLLAPQPGRETRQLIGRKAQEGRDAVSKSGREVYDKGRDLYERGKGLADSAAEAFEKGKEALARATRRAKSDSPVSDTAPTM